MNNKQIHNIILEELSKNEINSLIAKKIESNISSKDFEKKVKEIVASVINDFFKIMWQRNSMWKNNVTK